MYLCIYIVGIIMHQYFMVDIPLNSFGGIGGLRMSPFELIFIYYVYHRIEIEIEIDGIYHQ